MFRLQREESKIRAWENLQKAKAEAAIRKLEVRVCFSFSTKICMFHSVLLWEKNHLQNFIGIE